MNNNDMKMQTLQEMTRLLVQMSGKVNVLNALDKDSSASGCADLHDQLTTMFKVQSEFEKVVSRATDVVPG